ncbi:hypothetical protein AtEden1_Chr2g0225281 [Arabidopsis thaliana]
MCGGAWIVRDHIGQAKHHARDAFTPIRDRTGAELRCILWSLKALQDIHVSKYKFHFVSLVVSLSFCFCFCFNLAFRSNCVLYYFFSLIIII